MLTEEEKDILTQLVLKEIIRRRQLGESDWSDGSAQLFDIYRKL